MKETENTEEVGKSHMNSSEKKKREGSTIVQALFGVLGYVIIGLILLVSIPGAIPRLLGYEAFHIVSGSMEPAIPVGSAVFVEPCEGAEVVTGDVVAFYANQSIIVHRVVENDMVQREITTKGDANASMDMNPVGYENVIGKVKVHVPFLGRVLFLYTTAMGKVYMFSFLIAGFLLVILSSILKKMGPVQKKEEKKDTVKPSSLEKKYRAIRLVAVLLLLILVVVLLILCVEWLPYRNASKSYENAVDTYVTQVTVDAEKGVGNNEAYCPIQVDFLKLQTKNPDVVGWIYCEDTKINYPICRGEDNEYYLHHGYDKTAQKSGSIFMECQNKEDYGDVNTVLYGHHMRDGSMFAGLSKWQDQTYYESHPYLWLLTPDGTYRVELIAGFVTSADSWVYSVFREAGPDFDNYYEKVVEQSLFQTQLLEGKSEDFGERVGHYLMLSTCEYMYENARFVLFGKLVPVNESQEHY